MNPEPDLPTLTELYGRIRAKALTDADQRLLDSYLSDRNKAPFRGTPLEIDTCLRFHLWRLSNRRVSTGGTEAECQRVYEALEFELGRLLHDLRPEIYPPPEA